MFYSIDIQMFQRLESSKVCLNLDICLCIIVLFIVIMQLKLDLVQFRAVR